MSTVIVRTVAKAAMPLILLTAFAFMLQGHNLPGGGFIGGTLAVVAIGLIYIVYSIDYLEDNILHRTERSTNGGFIHSIEEDYRDVYAAGLVLAIGTGLVAAFAGLPFLTQAHQKLYEIPIYGQLHPASAVSFDTGVFLVVIGALLTVLSAVGEE